MPVARFGFSGGGEVLAVGTRQAAATALLRPDLAAQPVPTLWRSIAAAGPAPGLPLPGRPERLQVTASLHPGSDARSLGPMSASLSIQDADGIVYSVPAGVLRAGLDRLVARLSAAAQARYPLRLLAISLTYTVPIKPAPADATVTISGLAVSTAAAGPFAAPFVLGSALHRWIPAVSSAVLASSNSAGPAPAGALPSLTRSQPAAPGARAVRFKPGYGAIRPSAHSPLLQAHGDLTLTTPLPSGTVPAIATRAFLRAGQLKVGDTVTVAVGANTVSARIVAAVREFPTISDGQGGGLVMDQAVLQDRLVAQAATPVPVTEWWLRTATPAVPPGLPAGSVRTDRAQLAAALLNNPLADAPQLALLGITAAAALLAALGFTVSVTAGLRQRRTQNALLAALGVSRAAQARQLCLEQLMLSLPAAAVGLAVGAGLAWLLVPAVTLTATATAPVPPVLIEIPLGWTAGLALAVTAIPVLAAAATIAYRPDPAAQLRAAEAT